MSARVVVLGLSSLLASSCANGFGEHIREHTYPTEFHYVTQGELRSAMGRMADDARALDALLVHSPPRGEADLQGMVRAALRDMRAAAGEIDPAGMRTNHPLLEHHLPDLIRELDAALGAAEAEEPNYYLAASVAGACVHCHGHASDEAARAHETAKLR